MFRAVIFYKYVITVKLIRKMMMYKIMNTTYEYFLSEGGIENEFHFIHLTNLL